MPQPTQTTTIRAVREVAPEVREITLAPPRERVEFRPGQWLSLHLPVGEKPPLVRAYTLAAPPAPSGELVLCLDRVAGGLGSEYLFTVQPGDELVFAGPLGNFVLPESSTPTLPHSHTPTPPHLPELLWLARYTGVVPFRAMLLHLLAEPPESKVTLVYSARRPEDLAYHAELLRAAEEQPWFELIAVVDEPDQAGEYGSMGVWAYGRPSTPHAPAPPHPHTPTLPHSSGAVLDLLPELAGVTPSRLHHLTTSPPKALIPMVCGVREFVRPIRDYFYGLGYDRKAVKWENYD